MGGGPEATPTVLSDAEYARSLQLEEERLARQAWEQQKSREAMDAEVARRMSTPSSISWDATHQPASYPPVVPGYQTVVPGSGSTTPQHWSDHAPPPPQAPIGGLYHPQPPAGPPPSNLPAPTHTVAPYGSYAPPYHAPAQYAVPPYGQYGLPPQPPVHYPPLAPPPQYSVSAGESTYPTVATGINWSALAGANPTTQRPPPMPHSGGAAVWRAL